MESNNQHLTPNYLQKGVRIFKTALKDVNGDHITVVGYDHTQARGILRKTPQIRLVQACSITLDGDQVLIYPLDPFAGKNTIDLYPSGIIYEIPLIPELLFVTYVKNFWGNVAGVAETPEASKLPPEGTAEQAEAQG